MLESFLGGFVICQLLWKLLKTDNAFLKCFIGGFLVRILLEEQRTSFDVYCQFTFFVLNQAYVIYVFALPFILLLGSFPPGRLVLLVRWTTYVIYDLGIVMALVFFTLCFHFTIWVYNPFWPSPNLGESVQCTRYCDEASAYCSVLCNFSTLVCWTWHFLLLLPALSLFDLLWSF